MATTATASDLRIGSVLRNNDPRYAGKPNETITVIGMDTERVWYNTGRRTAYIAFGRIYTDGLKRHSGYNLLGQPDSIIRDRQAGIIR